MESIRREEKRPVGGKRKGSDVRALARILEKRLHPYPRPVSLNAAHALLWGHEDAAVRNQYRLFLEEVETSNLHRDASRLNPQRSVIDRPIIESALLYLSTFLKRRSYDEKSRQLEIHNGPQ